MTERTRRTEGSPDKDEAADSGPTEMDRFKALTRRLLHVPRDELAAEQQKAAETKTRKRRQSG